MTKSNKYFIVLIVFMIVIVVSNVQCIQQFAVKIFKLNETFITYYSDDKLSGSVIKYVDGRVESKGSFRNGMKNGWKITYHKNDRIKSKTFMKDDLAYGKTFSYSSDGKLKYTGFFLNGKPYGSWYTYYKDGTPESYILSDINSKSFSVNYDSLGDMKLKDMHGFVVSSDFYTNDPFDQHPVILKPYPEVNCTDPLLVGQDL